MRTDILFLTNTLTRLTAPLSLTPPRIRVCPPFSRHHSLPRRLSLLSRGLTTTTTTTMATSTTPSTTPHPSPLLTPTYDNALHLLSLLQSNKTIINLFAAAPNGADINASALPEMRAWLARAGHTPADLARLRCLHVAGTKGKGSVCALAASILRQYPQPAGRVGLYASPHLVSVRERICLDGAPLPRGAFTAYFFELWGALSDAARREGVVVPDDGSGDGGDHGLGVDGPATKPFYFRFLTLLAFHAFLREGVTSAVIECGIGGEYDSTNVLPPDAVTAAVVTQLGIDHVNMLGDTVEKIAWHKAGIFKEGVPAYTYQAGRPVGAGDGVLKVLGERAAEKGTSLSAIGDGEVDAWRGVDNPQMEGAFQKGNMALAALAARRHLQSLGHNFDDDDDDAPSSSFQNGGAPLPGDLSGLPGRFLAGLRAARLRGRCETVTQDRIQWYLDGAHTEDSLVQVARWFAGKMAGEDSLRVLIFNQQDRDAAALLRTLLDALQAEARTPNRKIFHHAFCPTNDEHNPQQQQRQQQGGSGSGNGNGNGDGAAPAARPDMSVQRRNCDVVRQFCPFTAAIPAESVSFALDMARNVMLGSRKSKDNFKVQVLVTGSFNLVGPALRLLEPDGEL